MATEPDGPLWQAMQPYSVTPNQICVAHGLTAALQLTDCVSTDGLLVLVSFCNGSSVRRSIEAVAVFDCFEQNWGHGANSGRRFSAGILLGGFTSRVLT